MGWAARVKALLGISAYTPPGVDMPSLGDASVDSNRKALGGQIQPIPYTRVRWLMKDLETAEVQADGGLLETVGLLIRSARKDGVLAGVLSTRTGGLVRLPKRFRGDPEIVDALEIGHESARSVFEEMFPSGELALLAADGILAGVGVGELVPVQGRDFPVVVRLDPAFLTYRWNENRWYFRSAVGLLPITPGDGRWILHTPGGRTAPWQHGLWRCVGRAYIRKEHALMHKDNWEAKLANPARVAISPQGAGEEQKQSWFRRVMAWGINTVFGLTPGYDVKLLESNGRGYDSFVKTIDDQNNEIVLALAGQTVTTDGGTGFANADIHKSIRADLIKETADGLSYTINTQGLPPWIVSRFGEERLFPGAVVEWDVAPPADRKSEAEVMDTAGRAIAALDAALAPHGKKPDVEAICLQLGIRITDAPVVAAAPAASANNVVPIRGAA